MYKKLVLITKKSNEGLAIRVEDIDPDFFDGIDMEYDDLEKSSNGHIMLNDDGSFQGNSILLDPAFDYALGQDDNDNIILVPLKKLDIIK